MASEANSLEEALEDLGVKVCCEDFKGLAWNGHCVPQLEGEIPELYLGGCDDNLSNHWVKFCPFCGKEIERA